MDSERFEAYCRQTINTFLQAEEEHYRHQESLVELSKSRKETLQRAFDRNLKEARNKEGRGLQEIAEHCSSQLAAAGKHTTSIAMVKA